MTAQTKDKMIIISATTIASVLLTFLGLWASGVIESRQEIKREVESKVNIITFEKHEADNCTRFNAIESRRKEDLDGIRMEIQGMRSDQRLDNTELRREIIQILKDQRK